MSQVRRGTLLTFDNTVWTAKVLVDGADVEATIPVGQWIPEAMVIAGSSVAILFFGETNTADGVILGPYGGASAFSYPIISGLTAGQVLRATSATAVAYGALDLANANAVTGTLAIARLGTTQVPTFGALNLGTATGATAGDTRSSGGLFLSGAQGGLTTAYASLANNGTQSLGVHASCLVLLVDSNGNVGLFGVNAAGATAKLLDVTGSYSITAGTAGKGNLYKSGTDLTLENKIGSAWTWSIWFFTL